MNGKKSQVASFFSLLWKRWPKTSGANRLLPSWIVAWCLSLLFTWVSQLGQAQGDASYGILLSTSVRENYQSGSKDTFLLVTDFVFQCLGGTLVGWWVSSLGLPFILVFCWPLFWSLGLLIILIVYFIIIFNNQRAFVSSLWTCLVFLVLLILFIIKYSICWFFF